MFKGINPNCMYFHAGCNHPLREKDRCESRMCPLMRDLNLSLDQYDMDAHKKVDAWADARQRIEEAKNHIGTRKKETIHLLVEARSVYQLNDMLIRIKDEGFNMLMGTQVFHQNFGRPSFSVIVEGPKSAAKKAKEIMVKVSRILCVVREDKKCYTIAWKETSTH